MSIRHVHRAQLWDQALRAEEATSHVLTMHARSTNRALLQASVVEVSTASDLIEAVADGALDILITKHLDLSTSPLLPTGICPQGCDSPVGAISQTRSIRGECPEASTADLPQITAPALVPLRPGQCILLAAEDMLSILSPDMWLDNLYLRTLVPQNSTVRRADSFVALTAVAPVAGNTSRYMTRMTFQGDNMGPTVGMFADEKVFIEDSRFLHLGGSQASFCPECSAAVVSRATEVSLKSCIFQSPYEASGSRYIRVQDAGAIRVENCTFEDAFNPLEIRPGSVFYADDPELQIEGRNQALEAPSPLEDILDPSLFLTRDDKWFAELRNELTGEPLPPPPPPPPPEPAVPGQPDSTVSEPGSMPDPIARESSSSSSDSQLLAAILGSAGAILIAIVAAVLLLVFSRRRKRKRLQAMEPAKKDAIGAPPQSYHAGPTGASCGAGPTGAPSFGVAPTVASMQDPSGFANASSMGPQPQSFISHTESTATDAQWQAGSPQPDAFGGRFYPGTNVMDTFWATRDPSMPSGMATENGVGVDLGPPGTNAPMADRLDFLHSQLDTLGADTPLMRRFVLLGYSHRRQGGQGLVAFARGVHDQLDYAIKFFMNRESFMAEQKLYESNTLGALLPQVEDEYDPKKASEELKDARGVPLPPFIVMEKGESLSDWTERAHPELFQGIAVLVHVATRLRDMHAAGYVHRDIKPGNIMFLPRKNQWTIIDFGCSARTDEPATLSFTVQYAAPEVAAAYQAEERTIVAAEAMDAWAMGVVAFELLTGGSAFSFVGGSKQIFKQLRGEAELPWEGEQNATARRKLGIFRQPILSLLHREPSERSTLAAFCRSCQQIFSSTSTDGGIMPMQDIEK